MLSEPVRELVERIEAADAARADAPRGEVLEVSSIVGRAASFYEKLRYLVDYREEHTIRRAALERILKRRVFLERSPRSGVVLLQELVDGKYIRPEEATEELAGEIDGVIAKYLELLNRANANGSAAKKLIGFAATEIDARISPVEYAIDHESVEAFFRTMKGRVSAYGYSDAKVNEQLYLACWRALLAADDDRVGYALWLLYVPEWRRGGPDFEKTARTLSDILAHIGAEVGDTLQWQIASKVKNEAIYFRIVRAILEEHRGGARHVLENPSELDRFTREFLEKKYERENERIQKGGIRAVIYLFITKMAVALLLELPYEIFVLGGIHYLPLTVNIVFHPLLLFALTRRVGALDEANTEAVIEGMHGALYESRVRSARIRNGFSRFTIAFAFAYLLLVAIVFGGIVGLLQLLEFNSVSIALFLFFLALVSYFAFRIRYQAGRWKISRPRGTLGIIVDVLAVPIVRTGGWLSRSFSSINIFVLFLDFIIETPFKRLLNFSNQFLAYLREKGEEIR